MSIEEIFSKRRQIRSAWDQKRLPSKETIKNLLERTLNFAPSKQNLYPFKIHAYGPDDLEKKQIIGQICSLVQLLLEDLSYNTYIPEHQHHNPKSIQVYHPNCSCEKMCW